MEALIGEHRGIWGNAGHSIKAPQLLFFQLGFGCLGFIHRICLLKLQLLELCNHLQDRSR